MATIRTDLQRIREQLERAQVEVASRETISATVIWDGQSASYVNDVPEGFNGLVVHLTPELVAAPMGPEEPTSGLTQNEFELLKKEIGQQLD